MIASLLQINTRDGGGGAESVALELHRAVRARRIEATLAVGFAQAGVPGVVEIPRGDGLGWRLHDAARRHGRPRQARIARSLGDPGVIVDLVRGREDFRFPGSRSVLNLAQAVDVVHLHNLHGGYFDLGVVPALSGERPTVLTLHDEWTLTGHCALTLGCGRWRDACGSCPHLDVYPRLRRDGTAFNLRRKRALWEASRLQVVAPTRWLLERAQASVLRHAATGWHVVSNGVDLDVFAPGDRDEARFALGLPPETPVLVFAAAGGRGNRFKDVATLERALALLGATADRDVVAFTIGERGETVRLGRVELRRTGFLDRPELVQHFHAADLYVHAARAEVQGLSLIEALATGLPAVASAVGGIPDVVRDGGTGAPRPSGRSQGLSPTPFRACLPTRRPGSGCRRPQPATRATASRTTITSKRCSVCTRPPSPRSPLSREASPEYPLRVLTIFSIPKPFAGSTGEIQATALASWGRLGDDEQVVLVGEAPETGAVERVEALQPEGASAPRLDDAFARVDAVARQPLRCFLNADIVLLTDLIPAVERAVAFSPRFLLVGQTRDLDPELVSGSSPDELRRLALEQGVLRGPAAIDWFVFSAGLFDPMPPFLVGRACFDNWMIWKARQLGPVIDATAAVVAIHQSHDYTHLAGGKTEAYYGPEAAHNLRLAGGKRHLYTLNDASHLLRADGTIQRNRGASLRWKETLRRSRAKAALVARRAAAGRTR